MLSAGVNDFTLNAVIRDLGQVFGTLHLVQALITLHLVWLLET